MYTGLQFTIVTLVDKRKKSEVKLGKTLFSSFVSAALQNFKTLNWKDKHAVMGLKRPSLSWSWC